MLGETLDGRYEIVRHLGQGGMGSVYEARDVGTGARVAVKVILNRELAAQREIVARFQREAKSAGSIDTQHIVRVIDAGTDAERGAPYMVMELLAGEDLHELEVRLGPLPSDLALRIAAQACIGLAKAHEAGVVHRDIKSANIFLAETEGEIVVKLLDFGIAKIKKDDLAESQAKGLTRTGTLLGSPLYMSPEQALGLKNIDHRTDIWSLGVVLYEALAGVPPHADFETIGQLIVAISSRPAPSIQRRAPWVSRELAALVHRALALDPKDRFQSAAAMREAVLEHLPDGCDIRESSLVSLGPEEKRQSALRLALPGEPAPSAASFQETLMAPEESHTLLVSPAQAPGESSRGGALPAAARVHTHAGMSTTGSRVARSRSRRAPLLLGVAGAFAALGFLAYRVAFAPEGSAALEARKMPNQKVTVAAIPDVSPPAETATPDAPPSPTVTLVETPPRRLAVGPAGVTVSVDGVHAAIDDEGTVTIVGAPGSVHAVTLSAGGRTTREKVVVVDDGLLPPRVELRPPASAPKAPAPPAATSRPAEPPPKPKSEIDRRFGE